MVHRRDETAGFHGGEDPFELLTDGLFAEMDDAFVIAAEENSIRIAFAEDVDIDSGHVFKRQNAFDACFTEPCEAIANISISEGLRLVEMFGDDIECELGASIFVKGAACLVAEVHQCAAVVFDGTDLDAKCRLTVVVQCENK